MIKHYCDLCLKEIKPQEMVSVSVETYCETEAKCLFPELIYSRDLCLECKKAIDDLLCKGSRKGVK